MLKREKEREREIAKERIVYLIERAEKFKNVDYELSRRYVELARKIAMKYRVRIPKKLKLYFCKKCLYPYKSGRFRVRINKSTVIITCLNCMHIRRFQLRDRNVRRT
ncbi:MAG: ribonuclease P [Archaeoglobaceae archaeon]|nr:ribonuclease P [Archaeoglobaceae archaeon]MDW8127789.1 ribonuclease P [Archaeoglobaceae archaeon]